MKYKFNLLSGIIFVMFGLMFFSYSFAASGECARDDGHGVICSGSTLYYCLGICSSPIQCPKWSGTVCASEIENDGKCPANCNGADSCGYCNSCSSGYTLCNSYPNQICKQNVNITNCISYNQCQSKCTACAPGYTLSGDGLLCLGATLNLGSNSVGAGGYLFQSTAPALTLDSNSILSLISQGGKFGLGITKPNKQIHVYNDKENPEIDIQSSTEKEGHWGIYSDIKTNDLRFWGGEDWLTIRRDGNVVVRSLSGSDTQCLQADSSGVISGTGSACGTGSGATLPSGSNGQTLRYSGSAWVADSNLFNNGTNILLGSKATITIANGNIATDGNITTDGTISSGLINGQRISSSANFTGSLNVASNLTVDTNTLYVNSTDNRVGIGTSSPQNELHIYNSSSGPIVNLEGDFGAQYQGIRIGDKDASNAEKWFMGSNNASKFVIRRNSTADNLSIDTTGNVTLSTTTIDGTLNIRPLCTGDSSVLRTDGSRNVICGTITATGGTGVNASGTVNYATYWTGQTTLGSEQYLSVSRGGTGKGTFTAGAILYGNGTNAISEFSGTGVLKSNGSSAPTALTGTDNYLTKWSSNGIVSSNIYQTTDNKIGIGKNNPVSELEIASTTNGVIIGLEGLISQYRGLRIGPSGTEQWFVGASSSDFVVRRGGNIDDMVFKSSGELQINVPTTIGTNKIQKSSGSGSLEFDTSGNLIITIP